MSTNTNKKSGWEEIRNDFNRNYFFCLFAWLLICLLFSKPINQLLGKLGGFLFLTDSTTSKSNEWLLIILLVSIYGVRFYFRKRITGFSLRILYLITPLVLWVILNLTFSPNPAIKFTKSAILSQIPQISILLVVWMIELLILILNYFKEDKLPKINDSSFITDIAFDPKDEDQAEKLGFENFANRIAEEIKTVSSKESVVFGINGEWGEGKTSMINLIRQQLEGEDYTVVDFHPWKTNSGKAMNQLFFDALKDGLKNKIWGINWKIDRYADALLQLDKTGISKTIWQIVFQPDSVEKQKEKLAESMKLLDKNLVVVVDDLDRLAKNEIADVLKLMRDTANFPNLVFLAAYDRAYLNEAIKSEINPHNYANYMDKIVLWEAPIYRPQPPIYINYLKEQLIDKLKGTKDISNDIEQVLKNKTPQRAPHVYNYLKEKKEKIWTQTNTDIYSRVFVNLRSVKRFINDFTFNYKTIYAKVDFEDFFHLSLIRHFYPKYYSKFKDAFFHANRLAQNSRNSDWGKISSKPDRYWDILIKDEELDKEENTLPIILELIYYLIEDEPTAFKKGSDCFLLYLNFPIYFYLGNYQDVPVADLSSSLYNEDIRLFKENLSKFEESGKLNLFPPKNLILAIWPKNSEMNMSDFLTFAKRLILLSIACNKSNFFEETHHQLQNTVNDVSEIAKFQEEVYSFIKSEEIEDKIQPIISLVLYEFKKAYEDSKYTGLNADKKHYLDINKSINIATNNYLSNINSNSGITSQTVNLFYCSYQKYESGVLSKNDDILQSMRILSLKYPDDFLDFIIVKITNSLDDQFYDFQFNPYLMEIYNSTENFIQFLNETAFVRNKKYIKLLLGYANKMEFGINGLETLDTFAPDEKDKILFNSFHYLRDLESSYK